MTQEPMEETQNQEIPLKRKSKKLRNKSESQGKQEEPKTQKISHRKQEPIEPISQEESQSMTSSEKMRWSNIKIESCGKNVIAYVLPTSTETYYLTVISGNKLLFGLVCKNIEEAKRVAANIVSIHDYK